MNSKTVLIFTGFFGALGVAIGAFGAHGLAATFATNPTAENTYRTAVQYHLFHTLALFGTAWLVTALPGRWSAWAVRLFVVGIVLFSGSLYLLAVFNVRFMGAIAPVGGVAFIAGWACVGMAAWRHPA